MQFSLFPSPHKLRFGSGHLPLAGRIYVKPLQPLDEDLTDCISRFCASAQRQLSLSYGAPEAEQVLLTIDLKSGPKNIGAYELTAGNDGLVLCAKNAPGIAYGLTTLGQILNQVSSSLPCLRLSDQPDFRHRGIMLDISRCKVPSMHTLYSLIDNFAELKINQLQLYTEHTFPFVNHATVWADSSPVTPEEILALKKYCQSRFIDLVPNLNSFGHFERWLRHPEYHKYAECPGGFRHPYSGTLMKFGSTLKPGRQSLQLLKELYDEYLPLFDSEFFNVGGDEPWELGHGWSKARCAQLGTTNVYINFMSDIRKQVNARGRKMMFWSDIVLRQPESLTKLSRDLVALNWGYEGNHPFRGECQQVAEQKIPFYVCPGTSSWNSLTGRIDNATRNLASAAKNGLKYGAQGYLITDWGDHGHHQYLPISYPGFLMGACQSWNARASRHLDLADGLNSIFFQEVEPTTAGLLIELGEVLELAPSPIRNASIFNLALFSHRQDESNATRGVPDDQLEACEAAMADIRARLAPISTQPALEQVKLELGNAIDMACHGIHKLQQSRGAQLSNDYLHANLQKIIGRHESLWLARNRPGGLRESTAYLA